MTSEPPEATGAPTLRLERWSGPWPDDDPDANLKADVAAYSAQDPLATLQRVAGVTGIPVGALARYVLVRWAAGGSEGLVELGPSTVGRMRALVHEAEQAGTDAARLEGFDALATMVRWLGSGLDDPVGTYPSGGAGPRRRVRPGAYGLAVVDDRVLLCRVAPGELHAGAWTLPGGGLHFGEDPVDAVRREFREETGLGCAVGSLLEVRSRRTPSPDGIRDDLHHLRFVYAVEPEPGRLEVVERRGSTDAVRWFSASELADLEVVVYAGAVLRRWFAVELDAPRPPEAP